MEILTNLVFWFYENGFNDQTYPGSTFFFLPSLTKHCKTSKANESSPYGSPVPDIVWIQLSAGVQPSMTGLAWAASTHDAHVQGCMVIVMRDGALAAKVSARTKHTYDVQVLEFS